MTDKASLSKHLAVLKAIDTIAEFLDLDFNLVASRLCMFDKAVMERLNTAIAEVNHFHGLSLADRAKAMGFTVVESGKGTEVSVEL